MPHRKNKNKETERYYLFPGQGGRNFRRKQRIILIWAAAAAIFFGGILTFFIWWFSRPKY